MSNELYDNLKTIALLMPIVITFITGMCELFNFKYTYYVVGVLALTNAALGALVKVANVLYLKEQKRIDDEWDELIDEE